MVSMNNPPTCLEVDQSHEPTMHATLCQTWYFADLWLDKDNTIKV